MVSIGAHSAMNAGELPALPRTSREVVVCLRQHGALSAEELAEKLHVTTSTVRQALAPLRAGEYVTYTEQGSGRGRRRHVYALTPRGQALFPGPPRDLICGLIDFLHRENPDLLRRFLSKHWDRGREDRAEQRLANAPFAARVRALIDAYDEAGFFPVVSPTANGAAEFTLVNCPLFDFARVAPELCDLDQREMEALVPGCRVERVAWRLEGAPLCSYRVHPPRS